MIAEICLALGVGWFLGCYMAFSSLSKKAKAGKLISLDGVVYRVTEVRG